MHLINPIFKVIGSTSFFGLDSHASKFDYKISSKISTSFVSRNNTGGELIELDEGVRGEEGHKKVSPLHQNPLRCSLRDH